MFDKNYVLAITIKNKILTRFIDADINIIFDKKQNEYFISTRNKELYYSEAYGMFVLEINQNTLWKQGVFNFFFILDENPNHFDKIVENISFDWEESKHYESWDIHGMRTLFVDSHVVLDGYSLAA